MSVSSFAKNKFKDVKTVEELKVAIVDILEEYDFGILSDHERRIETLEKESLDKTSKSYQERSKFEKESDEIIKRRGD